MIDTNIAVTGSGTASDPYIYNFHITAQSHWLLWMICVIGLSAIAGFLIGFYFGKRRKKSN